MTTLEGEIQDIDYQNWIKSTLCLRYTRDGLVSLAGIKSLELNQNVIHQLRLNGNLSVYNLCPTIAFDLRRKSISCCRYCNAILTEVMKYRHGRLNLNLRNSDPTKLLHQHWQCAKLFMSPGQDVSSAGPEDTELAGLLTFIEHCTLPRYSIRNPDIIIQVRDMRNRIMHKHDMKITEHDFQNVITPTLIDLLQDPGFLLTDPDANIAVEKIRAVKKADFASGEMSKLGVLDTETSKLPKEILRMDKTSVELYKRALAEGYEKDYNVRVMVVGQYEVGKTCLTKRLLNQIVDVSERKPTEGIDVYVRSCNVQLDTQEWTIDIDKTESQTDIQSRTANILRSHQGKEKREEKGNSGDDRERKHLSKIENEEPMEEANNDSMNPKDTKNEEPNEEADVDIIYLRDTEVPKSSKELDDQVLREIEELKQLNQDKSDAPNIARISLWDFAGQSVFYSTHQMFLTERAIYLLVNNLKQHIDNIEVDGALPYFKNNETQNLKIEEYTDIWLQSIHSISTLGEKLIPNVILVGTHIDELGSNDNREQNAECVFKAIRLHLAGKDFGQLLTTEQFAINNAINDPNIKELRKTIIDVASNQRYWGELKPAKWIRVEKLLQDERDKGVQIINRKQFKELNSKLPVAIASEEELDLFLRFQHDCGYILYFSTPDLRDQIVLNPQFLINALKSVITGDLICKRKTFDPDTEVKWKTFLQTGILEFSLLDAVWNKDENQCFKDNREHVLALMEHLHILGRPKVYVEGHSVQKEDFFVVSSMLKGLPQDKLMCPSDEHVSTPILCLVLNCSTFPSAIYDRLLVECIHQWPLATTGRRREYELFRGFGQFDVDEDRQHRLMIRDTFDGVELKITRYSRIEPFPNSQICQKVLKFISETLTQIGTQLGVALNIEQYIKCPVRELNTECRHAVEKLMKPHEILCHAHNEGPIIFTSTELLMYWFESATHNELGAHKQVTYNRLAFTKEDDDRRWIADIPEPLRTRRLDERDITKLAQALGSDWEIIMFDLGLTKTDMDLAKMEYQFHPTMQIASALNRWRVRNPNTATLETYLRACSDCQKCTTVTIDWPQMKRFVQRLSE